MFNGKSFINLNFLIHYYFMSPYGVIVNVI